MTFIALVVALAGRERERIIVIVRPSSDVAMHMRVPLSLPPFQSRSKLIRMHDRSTTPTHFASGARDATRPAGSVHVLRAPTGAAPESALDQ